MQSKLKDKLEIYIDKEVARKANRLPVDVFRVSSIGKCDRQVYYDKLIPEKKELNMSLKKIFLAGTIFHNFFQNNIFENAKREVRCERQFGAFKLEGHADIVDDSYVWELKTVSSLTYVKDEPNERHVKQLNTYLGLLGLFKGKIVYIDKRFISLVEHEVEFDQELFDSCMIQLKYLSFQVKEHKLPNRIDEDMDDYQCKKCWWKKLCKVSGNIGELL